MLPQNVLWDKRQSPSPKNIWVWVKAKGKVCLIAYEKEEHEGNMLNGGV
jgi:hypothetical protein